GDLRDRPARLDHDAYSTLAKLRRVRPLLGPHEPQLPLQSRTPRYEGKNTDNVPHHELGGTYFTQRDPERATRRAINQLNQIGYTVTLNPREQPA
ncbi:hypothetical protein ACFXN3_31305, partial [Streptomyces sp. NPDC059165]